MFETQWHIPLDGDYKRIENADSVQYVNQDGSRMIYASTLIVIDTDDVSREPPAELPPIIDERDNVFHLKGTKVRPGRVLVVVITFRHKGDEEWAKRLFHGSRRTKRRETTVPKPCWDRRLNKDTGPMRDLHLLGSANEASTNSGGIVWDPEAKQISDRVCVSGKS